MLEIQNVSFSYQKKQRVLSSVSLKLERGEIGVILGRNGSGKSTLIQCIDGILKPEEGNILLDGKNIQEMKRGERAQRIAYVSQDSEVPALSVYDFVLLGRLPYIQFSYSKEDHERTRRCLERLNLQDLAMKSMSSISGGEKQKAHIARALVSDAELILFDEPTNNLDIHNQIHLLEWIKELQEKDHKTILLIMHDLSLSLEIGTHFYLMKQGKLLYEGEKEIITEKTIEDTLEVHSHIHHVDGKILVTLGGNKHD